MNSECTQQDRADENEYGAHCQYFESQGKLHGSCLPCCDDDKLAQNAEVSKRLRAAATDFACQVMHCGHGVGNRLIARHKATQHEKYAAAQYRLAWAFVGILSEN
ncbi:MAG: hypothetical protein HY244_04310 [Rhizobiales bacterium]|nr:hypothetical protein [Hyphomicrobiales bacterium]